MKNAIKIVLLGSLPKGDEVRKNWVDWKAEYIRKISKKIPNVTFLHGDLITDEVGSELVVGHDLWLIKHSDIAIVNAPSKIGAGTAQEIVLAKLFEKPVISIIPKDTHHRKSNIVFSGVNISDWIHPFLDLSSDFIAEDVNQTIKWIKNYIKNAKSKPIKDISVFDSAISNFEKKLPKISKAYKDRGW